MFRLSYDASRHQVRVIWHFILDTRPVARPVHIDGISVYVLNSKGLVRRHDIETIVVNGTPVKPPLAQITLPAWVSPGLPGGASAPGLTTWTRGVVASVDAGWGSSIYSSRDGVEASSQLYRNGRNEAWHFRGPFFFTPPTAAWQWSASPLLQSTFRSSGAVVAQSEAARFQATTSPAILWSPTEGSTLRSHSSSNAAVFPAASDGLVGATRGGSAGEQGEGSSSKTEEGGDNNDKGGGEENKKDEKKVNEKKTPEKRKKKKKAFWPISDGPWGCETSWDCTGGYVCCDLILIKICCSNGLMQPKEGDLVPVWLPIPGRGRTELDN